MEEMSTIEQYNQYLVNNRINQDMSIYMEITHRKYYNKVDISFASKFTDDMIYRHDEMYIPHTDLIKEYGIINNLTTDKDIIYYLEDDNGFVKNKDYTIQQINNKNVYLLTPMVLKICLMRAEHTLKYVEYFLYLEKQYNNYRQYQTQYLNIIN